MPLDIGEKIGIALMVGATLLFLYLCAWIVIRVETQRQAPQVDAPPIVQEWGR